MVFFRNGEPGLPDGDAPRLLRMSSLHHSFRMPRPSVSVDRERVDRVDRRLSMLADDKPDADAGNAASVSTDPVDQGKKPFTCVFLEKFQP